VLVGVDGSSQSRDAVAFGSLLTAAHGDQLVLVHAHGSGAPESLSGAGGYEEIAPEATQTEIVAERSPAAALRRLAAKADTRAIVVGSSHRGRVGRVVPGGVAQHLLSSAHCPVVVAPGGYADRTSRQLQTVGCGFDGSASSREAWHTACASAAGPRATVRAIAVHERIAFGHLPASISTPSRSVNDELRADLRRALDALVADTPDGVRAEAVFAEGVAATVLIDASQDLDLLVVGSRGHGPTGSVLLGSVSSRLIVAAACPVMVVPRSSG
jgi:nucleotide-binding universal stress UspA family protein